MPVLVENPRDRRWRRTASQRAATEPKVVPNCSRTNSLEFEPDLLEGCPLSDDELRRFIVEGFLELPLVAAGGVDASVHDAIFKAALKLGDDAENLGNNILPAIPALLQVYGCPRVSGALRSLLGPGFLLHPHRFCHRSVPGRQAQDWHRDSFFGFWHPRNPFPYWVMCLYFPQDTPLELGPTDVLPGSHYFGRDEAKTATSQTPQFGCMKFKDEDARTGVPASSWKVRPKALVCKAGTAVLMHYDLWHRGPGNTSPDGMRFMFKFQFSRLASPSTSAPRVGGEGGEAWRPFLEHGYHASMTPVWQSVWDFLHGHSTSGSDVEPERLLQDLCATGDANEVKRVSAAWLLAARAASKGESGGKELVESLENAIELQGRETHHALEAAGSVALPPLLSSQSLGTSAVAVRSLGRLLDLNLHARKPVDQEQSLTALRLLKKFSMSSADKELRSCAAEGLGFTRLPAAVSTLLHILETDRIGDVRATAALSLLRLLEADCLEQRRSGH